MLAAGTSTSHFEIMTALCAAQLGSAIFSRGFYSSRASPGSLLARRINSPLPVKNPPRSLKMRIVAVKDDILPILERLIRLRSEITFPDQRISSSYLWGGGCPCAVFEPCARETYDSSSSVLWRPELLEGSTFGHRLSSTSSYERKMSGGSPPDLWSFAAVPRF